MRRYRHVTVSCVTLLTLLAGCEEQPLNSPITYDELRSGEVQLNDATWPEINSDLVPEPSAEVVDDAETKQPPKSATQSIFNALKNGAANALEELPGPTEGNSTTE